MCKVQDISSDDLSALAIKLKAKLPGGILPPRTEARLCWRALALESTFQLTRLDDNVMAFLNRLDDLGDKGVVDKPAAALLLAVRCAHPAPIHAPQAPPLLCTPGADPPERCLPLTVCEQVRTEMCVRHLRGSVDLQAFKVDLDTYFPASKDYDVPGSRLERSRRVQNTQGRGGAGAGAHRRRVRG